jgi:hypothetical protein
MDGMMGMPGEPGRDGVDGATGPPGMPGMMGMMGMTGPQGPPGMPGMMGMTGPQGPAGATGATGATGTYTAGTGIDITDGVISAGVVANMDISSLQGSNIAGVKTIFLSGSNGNLTSLNGGVKGQIINLVFAPSLYNSHMVLTINSGGNMGIVNGIQFDSSFTGGIVLIYDGTVWRLMNGAAYNPT